LQKLLIASFGTLMYVVKLFLPVRLSALYPYPAAGKGLGPEFYVAFVTLLVLLTTVVYLCRRSRAARAIALNPGYRGAYANRAIAYAKMHEYEKSIADKRLPSSWGRGIRRHNLGGAGSERMVE